MAGGCSLDLQRLQPLYDQGKHRVAVTVRGLIPATAGPAGGAGL